MVNVKYRFVSFALLGALSLAASTAAANTSQRIIGGQPVFIDSAPSIVALVSSQALEISGSASTSQFCGGTLITPTWVLTAAHCVNIFGEVLLAEEVQVVANSSDLNNIVNDPIGVSRIIAHENFSDFTNENDIALLQLSSPAVQGPEVASLNTTPVPINEALIAAGWGARQFDFINGSFDFSNQLHAVEVLGLPAEQCNTLPAYAGIIFDSMLCAGVQEGGRDTCQGDSGGPLYRQNSDGSLTVAGITSFGEGCGLALRPGVYTDVASFTDWIQSNAMIDMSIPVVAQTEPVDDVSETSLAALDSSEGTSESFGEGSSEGSSESSGGGSGGGASGDSGGGSSGGSGSVWLVTLLAGFVGIRRRKITY